MVGRTGEWRGCSPVPFFLELGLKDFKGKKRMYDVSDYCETPQYFFLELGFVGFLKNFKDFKRLYKDCKIRVIRTIRLNSC